MSDIILIRTPEYEIRGEFLWFGVVLHGDVFVRWCKGVRNRLKTHIDQIARSISQPVYAFHAPSHDPLKRKFIKDVGMVLHHYRTTGDGELAEMYLARPLD